jgi:hypothetical protein
MNFEKSLKPLSCLKIAMQPFHVICPPACQMFYTIPSGQVPSKIAWILLFPTRAKVPSTTTTNQAFTMQGTFEKCGALLSLACFKNSTHRGVYSCTALSSPNRWEASKVPFQTRIPHATLIGDHKALNKIL